MLKRRAPVPLLPESANELEADHADPALVLERDEYGSPVGAPCSRDGIAFDRWGNPTGAAEV